MKLIFEDTIGTDNVKIYDDGDPNLIFGSVNDDERSPYFVLNFEKADLKHHDHILKSLIKMRK